MQTSSPAWRSFCRSAGSAGRRRRSRQNSVGTNQLKNNAVTGKKIKKGTVKGREIGNRSITRSDIDLTKLGKVPLAASADSASAVATSLGPITTQVPASASGANADAARALATEVPLVSNGQITLYGKCFIDTSTNVLYGQVLFRTSADGALALSTNDVYSGDPAFANIATPENARAAFSNQQSAGSAGYSSDSIGTLIGPNGAGLQYHGMIWLKHGTVAGVSPLNNATDICRFSLDGVKL